MEIFCFNSIMISPSVFWFFFSFFCLIFELTNPGLFYFLSASSASLVIGIISLYPTTTITTQCMLFVGLLCIFFIILRSITNSKYMNPKEHYKSHLTSILNKEGVVISEISAHMPGQVCIKNEIWLAYPQESHIKISVEKRIQVTGIQGAHLIVKVKE